MTVAFDLPPSLLDDLFAAPAAEPRSAHRPGRRAALAERAIAMRADGATQAEIADALGVSRSYASALCTDPDGAKDRVRKASYGGSCIDCGARTDGSNGRAEAPDRCAPCRAAYQSTDEHRESIQFWTREKILDAIREWAALHGEPPAAPDWGGKPNMDPERHARFVAERPRWPWFTTVHQRFGSWNAALEAAGFEARPPHGGGGNQYRRGTRRP